MSLPEKGSMEGIAQALESQRSAESRDYAGAQAKTDPEEIALVRKLDRRIMVSLWF